MTDYNQWGKGFSIAAIACVKKDTINERKISSIFKLLSNIAEVQSCFLEFLHIIDLKQ